MFVADTHAWVYYILDKLPKNLDGIFKSVERSESTMFIPTIVLTECIHLAETNKISISYKELFSRLEESENFSVVPLDLEITKTVPQIKLKEIHDRIIVATAIVLDSTLLTKDREIARSRIVKTLWFE